MLPINFLEKNKKKHNPERYFRLISLLLSFSSGVPLIFIMKLSSTVITFL